MAHHKTKKRIVTIGTGRGRVRIFRNQKGRIMDTKNLGTKWRRKSKYKKRSKNR